tara:strand:- start:623 stop:751 length:129 start_codon:yes stop_codon:yes gene_type:complete
MTSDEFERILQKNKKQIETAMKEFEKHSESFNKKIKKIFSVL